jgi:hypothetical protein
MWILASLGLVSCGASTSMMNTWRDPTVTGPLQFQKVLVVMVSEDATTRRQVEDQIVKRIKTRRGVEAVPSYTLLTGDDLKDGERAKQILADAGFDGAVDLRLVSKDQEMTYTPGSYPQPYYSFYGYYDYAWPMVYQPGYLATDTIVTMETLIYSMKDNKLVWSGTTETFNPSSLVDMVEGIADQVSRELTKQGLLK